DEVIVRILPGPGDQHDVMQGLRIDALEEIPFASPIALHRSHVDSRDAPAPARIDRRRRDELRRHRRRRLASLFGPLFPRSGFTVFDRAENLVDAFVAVRDVVEPIHALQTGQIRGYADLRARTAKNRMTRLLRKLLLE